MLQRHGARYPSYDDNIVEFVEKLAAIQNATGTSSFFGDLDVSRPRSRAEVS